MGFVDLRDRVGPATSEIAKVCPVEEGRGWTFLLTS